LTDGAGDAVMPARQDGAVPLGVVDVGSNTVRLVVSRGGEPIYSERSPLRLGECVEQFGAIPDAKLAETAACVAALAAAAKAHGAVRLEVLITSPGRQAVNGADLLERVAAAARCPARVLSAEEEGRLAFVGALSELAGSGRTPAAVVDVGGGSAQVVVGTRLDGPSWIRSIDLGSLRLTSRCLADDPPAADALGAARSEVERALVDFDVPETRTAFAVGGTARALRRLVGTMLGADELAEGIRIATSMPMDDLMERYGLRPHRVKTVTAGALILEGLQRRIEAPLRVVRSGVREGALLELGARVAAARAAA
jgi:exopolyphosphatase/guanosine-5'-triphosphate,3'-diphosphate pyrophosphatase